MATNNPTPSDYDPGDSVSENALDQCAHCQTIFAPGGSYDGTVYDKDGQTYEHVIETDVTDRPFFCESCYRKLDTNKKQQQNSSLGDFA